MNRSAEEIRKEVMQLSDEELRAFREWYENFDAEEWDRQMEKDVADGKLDDLAKAALSDHEGGKSRRLK